jgi:hypothetical protein
MLPQAPPIAAAEPPHDKPADPVARALDAGVAYILRRQSADGGWCEGDEKGIPGVAHTALNALALVRAGGGKGLGPHAKNAVRAVEFVCAAVEKADPTSPKLATPQGTVIQTKLGAAADTFFALWLLAEVRGRMPDDAGNRRVAEALDGVIAKVERNQNPDGSWSQVFFSPLGLAVGVQALARAREAGAVVNEARLARAKGHALESAASGAAVWKLAGSVKVPADTKLPEGVKPEMPFFLDSAAAYLGAAGAAPRAARGRGQSPEVERTVRETADGFLKDLNGPQWVDYLDHVDGFRGGEEYLSYLFVSEAQAGRGGKDWDLWRGRVARRLVRQQHKDGSWSAEHCLCGGNFCTPAAVLTLLADPANRK